MTAAVRGAPRAVGARAGSALDLTLPLTIGGVDRLRRAAAQARAIGGDAEWLGRHIEIWLADQPDERLRRRDAAIAEAAQFCGDGSDRAVAKRLELKLSHYETTRWRRERMMAAAPLAHGALGAALFAIVRASGASGAPRSARFVGRSPLRALGHTSRQRWPKKRVFLKHRRPREGV